MAENKMPENNNEVEVYLLQDENGQEYEFEVIAKCEKNGTTYLAVMPTDEESTEEDVYEYAILKTVMEDGEEMLVSVDDDDEFDDIADYFDDLFATEIDYDQK
jgi:uncharacterized protein YrzB (UPF0473 family)